MKKNYINPKTLIVAVKTESLLGITSMGNEYNSNDVTYGRGHDRDLWDDEEE